MKSITITALLLCASSSLAHPITGNLKRAPLPQGPLIVPEIAAASAALPVVAEVATDVGLPVAEKIAGSVAGGGLKAVGKKVLGKLGGVATTVFPLAGLGLLAGGSGGDEPKPQEAAVDPQAQAATEDPQAQTAAQTPQAQPTTEDAQVTPDESQTETAVDGSQLEEVSQDPQPQEIPEGNAEQPTEDIVQ